MENALQEKNKALVLEAFDTLFNKRDYVSADVSGRQIIFSTVHTFSLVETASSILLRALRPR
jgi:hypothetical protein